MRLGLRPVHGCARRDFVKKPMKDCTGAEITQEWLYHLGVPVDQIPGLAENSAVCVPTMMPYITAFTQRSTVVIPDGCVNFAFLGQFAQTPRDTVFTTEYSVRTAMEAVYGLLGVDRGVPEVWGSVYDIRDLLDASVKLMDGKSPLDIELPGPLNAPEKAAPSSAAQDSGGKAAGGSSYPASGVTLRRRRPELSGKKGPRPFSYLREAAAARSR